MVNNRLACVVALVAVVSFAASVKPASAPNVQPWLLGVKDLPARWYIIPSPPSERGCFSPPTLIAKAHPGSVAQEELYNPDGGYLGERVASWAAPADAERAWRSVDHQLAACGHSVLQRGTTPMPVTVRAINLGRYGQLSSAYQIGGNDGTIPEVSDYVLAKKGRAVISLAYAVYANGLQPGYVEALFRIALGKVEG
ncbi:MAG TPA: hypothetical protein VL984_14995 [Acidimicrobiales bacterium]|nr:hypothetical protein [Acidimicrobiales bacterium]